MLAPVTLTNAGCRKVAPMKVEDMYTGRMVRVPRKTKKAAKKDGVVLTAKVGRAWLAVPTCSRSWLNGCGH
jgi:hypothetical protein